MKKKPANRKVVPAVTIRRPIVLVATALLAALALLVSTAGTLTAQTVVATTNYSQRPSIQDYQGAGFNSESLSSNISGMDVVNSLAWNGSYWLIGGGIIGSIKTLVKYDGGSTYTDLTSNISGMDYVSSLAWNGSYWLIGGGIGGTKTLVKYDGGSTYTDLTSNISGMISVHSLAWNGSYWLIGGGSVGIPKTLVKYDGGSTYTDLTSNISGMDYVNSLAWNGSYWLIGGGTKTLVKYDGGSTYTDLTSNISGMISVHSLAWNGSYWLIGGEGSKTLIKYDGGSTYTDLTSNISGMDYVYSLAWNGSYWFIGGSGSTKTLVKYDGGSTYTDLTSNISGMHVWSLAWNGSYWLIGGIGQEILYKLTETETPALTWYLAEGSTDYGFSTYIIIENPNSFKVTCKVTFMTKAGPRNIPEVTLPAMSQTVLNPASTLGKTDFSTKIQAEGVNGIAVDRRMFWTGPGAASPEGHSSIGVTAPAKTWYLPEGSSDHGFECWTLVQNPNSKEANVSFTYMIEGAAPKTVPHPLKANSRDSFSMEKDLSGKYDASIKVESNIPVIPERSMYRNNKREGHNSIGTTTPAKDYFLAEGSTAWGFTTYVLIQNPNSKASDITLTYMKSPSGTVTQTIGGMPANSRKTVNVGKDVPGMANTDFSTKVHGTLPIIAERAMYWGADTPLGEACHDSIGMSSAHKTFYLPDGETTSGCETWTLVMNPNSADVKVEISYLTTDGKGNKTFTTTVGKNSRKSFNMADAGIKGRAAIKVTCKTSKKKIMVERAMYWNSRGAGTDTIGGYSE